MAARVLCDGIARLIRTPILYLSAYIPASVMMQSPGEFRRRSLERMVDGTITVMTIQKMTSAGVNPWIDFLVMRLTDMCDGDFYFMVLPIGFWLGDHQFFRWQTIITCIGVFFGAMLKDLYRLPRPPETLVWRASVANDATNAKDYGFVSTHTTNAVTNAGCTVLFMIHTGIIAADDVVGMAMAAALACLYPVAIGLSRMYVGLHSPQDVYGGAFLGLILVILAHPLLPWLDAFLQSATLLQAAALIFGGAITLLIAHPQPRPMTVTFLHDCEMMGLAVSCAFASWLYSHDAVTSTIASAISPYASGVGPAIKAAAGAYVLAAARVLVGLLVTAIAYAIGKHLGGAVLQLLTGVSASKVRKAIESSEPPQNKYSKRIADRVIRRLTEQGDPLGLLSLVSASATASAAVAEADMDFGKSDDSPTEAVRAADDDDPTVRLRRPRNSSSSRISASKASILSPVVDDDEHDHSVSYAEVPIRIVPDEPPMRGLELAVAGAVKLLTYTCVGIGIVALAPGVQNGLGLEAMPYV